MPVIYACTNPSCNGTLVEPPGTPISPIQRRCTVSTCFARFELIENSVAPIAPGPAPAINLAQINHDLRQRIYERTGTFCHYRTDYWPDRGRLRLKCWAAGECRTETTLTFEAFESGRAEFETPRHHDDARFPGVPNLFVMGPTGSIDWIHPPDPLPQVRVGGSGPHRNDVKSFGHGSGMTLPFRLHLGRQDEDQQHSGSGLVHLIYSHGRDDLNAIRQLFSDVLRSDRIGAIYKTRVAGPNGRFRYFFLSRSSKPNVLIADAHDDHFHVITLYKIDGTGNANKFYRARTTTYSRLYSADKDKY